MKKLNFVLIGFLLLLSSCATVKQLHESPSVDSIEIHDNPKVGDYATIEDEKQGFKNTWTVLNIQNGLIDVSFLFEFKFIGFSKRVEYLMTVDKKGKVKKAAVKYSEDNIQPQTIAQPGLDMSRRDYAKKKLPKTLVAKTKAGDIKIDEIATYNLSVDQEVSETHNAYISELSDKIPFRTVRMYQMAKTEEGFLLSALEYMKKHLQAKLMPHDILKKLIKKNFSDDDSVKVEYVLTDFKKY